MLAAEPVIALPSGKQILLTLAFLKGENYDLRIW
jgi:hypothetical protein